MPYIIPVRRHGLADALTSLDVALEDLPGGPGPGDLNYCITEIIGMGVEHGGVNYRTINELIGILECAKLELYRRLAAPYEDQKAVSHGDIDFYKENGK